MAFTLIKRRARLAALGLSIAFLAATAVSAEDQTTPAPESPESAAPAAPAPAEQGNGAPTAPGAAPSAPEKAAEQQLPAPEIQQALVKSTLLSLGDATVTENWNVFQATLSDELRKVVNPEKLKQSFGAILAPVNGLAAIAGMPISPQLALINNGNVLVLQGSVDVPNAGTLKYTLKYVLSARGWKLFGLDLVNDWSLSVALPDAVGQEALVRSTLVTFNDANISGDYSVLYSKLATNFRNQMSAEKLKQSFKTYDQVDMTAALGKPITLTQAAKIDKGVLKLVGTIKLSEKSDVIFDLDYQKSEGEWKPLGLEVKLHVSPNSDGWAR